MGNARRNWHRLWTVDLAARTAEHESGLIVRFSDGHAFPVSPVRTHCMADGVGEWTGVPEGGDDTLAAWASSTGIRDPKSVRSRLERLMKESGRVWARAKADEAKKNEHEG